MISFAKFNYNTTGSTRSYGGGSGGGGLQYLFFIVVDILSQAVIILISLAVVFFLYGILKYIGGATTRKAKRRAKTL